jgi:ketosteroid isomerase-like protein
MTSDHVTNSTEMALTGDPGRHPAVFAAAFNSGRADLVENVYDPGAVFVPEPGVGLTHDQRIGALGRFLDLGLPIVVRPRHTYVADDIALLIVDWTITGRGRDGEQIRLDGTATDVARRGPDGFWRYLIDNPFGTA